MLDFRPVGYVIGLLVATLGLTMLVPMGVDWISANGNADTFLEAALISVLAGGLIALACANGVGRGLSIEQTFLLTTGVWVVLPVFGALPFFLGAPEATVTDAYFEAMSGLTTTGSTVFTGLDNMPQGTLLWRSMMQWFGGIGIVVVAMVFLPELRVGGMQIFKSEAFDTMGKILPRAAEIASKISLIYVILTFACYVSYRMVGMDEFFAINHALTTVSTGGFSTHDASFGEYQGAPEYVASVFMVLAALPFVRYVQIISGEFFPFVKDGQARGMLVVILGLVVSLTIYRIVANDDHMEHAFREALFNVTSIMTGTGYASVDYQLWGGFAVVTFFFVGLIGGCAGSTACSIKIFRYQIFLSALKSQLRSIFSPRGVFVPRYEGRPVDHEILSSVMSFFMFFAITLGVVSIMLSLTGLDFITSVSGAATALANVGPGLGDTIGPAGNFAELGDTAKWILTAAMLIGRLEIITVYVLFTLAFWQR